MLLVVVIIVVVVVATRHSGGSGSNASGCSAVGPLAQQLNSEVSQLNTNPGSAASVLKQESNSFQSASQRVGSSDPTVAATLSSIATDLNNVSNDDSSGNLAGMETAINKLDTDLGTLHNECPNQVPAPASP